MTKLVCVVCEVDLETEDEIEMELCSACSGNADSCNNNKNKEEVEDNGGDSPASVDHVLNREKPLNFSDFPLNDTNEDLEKDEE